MANFHLAQNKAESLIEKYKIDAPLVNVFVIAQEEGLTLKRFNPSTNEKLKDVAGFLDPATKTIYINETDPPNRVTFTVAHELGHYILEHQPDKYGVLPRWQKPGTEKTEIEREADAFAANLLVPKTLLKKVLSEYKLTKDDVLTLAKMFGVSEEVMRYRLMRV